MNAPETIDKPLAGITVLHPKARPLTGDALAARRQRARRATFIKWLRKMHGWIGLWGATLGLLFGVTGVVLNHRAAPLRIPTGEPQVEELQLALPSPAPATPAAMTKWLQRELHVDGKPGRVRKDPAQPVAWGGQRMMQPEHWQLGIFGPRNNVQADYWVGNGFVSVKRTGNTFLTTLNNLHRGVGMNLFWVLLMDTIAGSLILLSLTGVLLWTELNKRRTVGVVLVGAEDVFEIQDDDIDRCAVVRFAPELEEAMTDLEKREFWGRRSISKNSQGHKRATEFDGAGFDHAPFKLIDNTF